MSMKPTYEELQLQLAAVTSERDAAVKAELAWEKTMMDVCGEDGPASVATVIKTQGEQMAAVVAENAGLKELIEQHAGSIAVCPNCSHEEPSETDDIVALYRSLETPATDAYLAEVRAQGVEMCAEHLLSNDEIGVENEYPLMREFAAQLRQGAEK